MMELPVFTVSFNPNQSTCRLLGDMFIMNVKQDKTIQKKMGINYSIKESMIILRIREHHCPYFSQSLFFKYFNTNNDYCNIWAYVHLGREK